MCEKINVNGFIHIFFRYEGIVSFSHNIVATLLIFVKDHIAFEYLGKYEHFEQRKTKFQTFYFWHERCSG